MKKFITLLKTALVLCLLVVTQSLTAQCNKPTLVTVSDLTSTTVTVSWQASVSAPGIGYGFEIRTSGTPGSGALGLAKSGTTLDGDVSVDIIELAISTNYNIYVRYQCSQSPAVYSAWTTATTFQTDFIETPVANPATYISDSFFTASWIPLKGVSTYRLDVSEQSDFSTFLSGFEDITVNNSTKFISVGLLPNTTYYYRVRAQATGGIGLETSANSNVIAVTTLDEAASYIVWTENGWVPDIEPTIDLDVIIDYPYNSGGQDGIDYPFFECKSLTVNPGAQYILGSGTSLVINNEVVNNAGPDGLIVESNASLVQLDDNAPSNSGAITVKRNSSALFKLDYTMWSSPVLGTQTLKEFSPFTVDSRFYDYATSSDTFATISNPSTVSFAAGKGYMIRIRNNHVPYVDGTSVPATWEGLFVGVPNNGVVSVPLSDSGNGYNLIGNPYPSVISAEGFIANNTTSIDGTIYFWRRRNNVAGTGDTGSFYATYTRFGGTSASTSEASDSSDAPNGFIQVGQGFLVKAKPAATEVVFTNSLREFEEFDDQFFRTAAPVTDLEKHRIWLNLTNDAGVASQILVGYAEGATNGYDDGFDGKFINDSAVALTSLLDENEYSIQAKALPFVVTDVIPLGLKVQQEGQYTISLNDFDGVFDGEQNIYLYDALTETYHDLKESAYVFASTIGVHHDRFELRFTTEALGVTNPFDANAVVVFTKDNSVQIEADSIVLNTITVFDIQGRKLLEMKDVNASSVALEGLPNNNQVLLIRMTDAANNVLVKKFVF